MNHRRFHALDQDVSEVGIGTWQLGGAEWGDVPESQALEILHQASESGTTLIDTADIYGDGRSEKLIGKFLQQQPDPDRFTVLTKFGRRSEPGWPENFRPETVRQHAIDSIQRLGVESLDLTQTHCVPDEYLNDGSVWQALRDIQSEGLIKAFGASVESMDEAQRYLNVDGIASLQIIFNVFRQKPAREMFAQAAEKNVMLIVRLPLASGLLAGKFTTDSQFAESDHRSFNVDGDAFNVGETFAGLGLATGVELADQLKKWVPQEASMAQWAIRWCLDFPAVTTVIPGASKPEQAASNAAASDLPVIPEDTHLKLQQFYDEHVHDKIRGKY